ncbi:hypothetical protein L1049_022592 [Liquidambar formosana]|uniref:Uncharacterized protein n=1 Tax=Liquidambar formosana TaxID=63359 RepID=A0AAP0RCS3_LIQFO
MITVPEITDLLARLASHLQTLAPHEEEACDLAISKLNRSLNLSEEDSRVRVLSTALSLMCFKAPQVFDSVIDYNVKTIVAVLSSSISCKVLRFQEDEVLQIGSLVSSHDCVELIESCVDVIGRLEGYGVLAHLLSYAVVRVVVLASFYQHVFPSIPIYDVKSIDGRSAAVLKLLCHLPRGISNKDHEIPLRLLLWYLDPLILKHDVSKIMQEAMERPFICLNKECHERIDWHSVIVSLVLSPTMFIETRALLHKWFLVTGLASVLELLVELVSVILDVVSQPTWWGISVEMGSKLPFSNAYFPYKHLLLRILAGPLSSENFSHLVHVINEPVSRARKHSNPAIKQAAMEVATIDHKSSWAMAMNFPDWFLFASVLLFPEKTFQDSFNSKCTLGAVNTEQAHDVKPPSSCGSAASYIAWILSPISQSHQDLLGDLLTKYQGLGHLNNLAQIHTTKKQLATGRNLRNPNLMTRRRMVLS